MKTGVIAFFLLAWALLPGPAAAGGAPKLVAPESAFEFAPVFDGEEVVHDYVIRNEGTAPLLITDIKAG